MLLSAMADEWFARLKDAIAQDERSLRQLSTAMGRGQNYLQQALKDGKEMGAGKVMSILQILGPDLAMYVLTGQRITPIDRDFLGLIHRVDQADLPNFLALLRTLADRSETP